VGIVWDLRSHPTKLYEEAAANDSVGIPAKAG
jgi:hypothetical protein